MSDSSTKPRRLLREGTSRRCGLTLAEVVVATILVALILVGALNGVGGALKMWSAAERTGEAYGLAQQLKSEIMQQNYEEPLATPQFGREPSESAGERSNWDDVDDYDGWSSAPENKDGSAIADYADWTRAADVDWVERDTPNTTSGFETGLKRITVRVIDPDGVTTELIVWRSDAGVLETPPETNVTVQSWVGNKLIVGDSNSLHNGTALVNKPE